MWPKNKSIRTLLKSLIVILLVAGLVFGLFIWAVKLPAPKITSNKTPQSYTRVQLGPDSYKVDNCWLKKNKYGIWEMYLEGSPYERGLIYGVLAKELMEKQEVHFVDQIKEIIPNAFFLQILKGFVAWFNKDIYKYIQDENLQEIYGVSQSFSDKFNYIGPKYYRILNYHAAHDIGHALTDLNMVGCTSFAVKNSLSADSSLLIGRNFDFYMGDAFAEDKLIVFINPDKGYKFASYSWAGLTGVVSGINEKGITVTLNASKSDIPYGAKEPISLLAREILQYAATIEQADSIAKKRDTFVSESLLIGSANDNKAAIIEKSPTKMDLYSSSSDYLVCANHYQGTAFIKDSVNIKNIADTDSKARFDRMNQLMVRSYPVDVQEAADILRNKEGVNDTFIGYGNSRSLNQLIAHHGIIFKPSERKVWISTPPYQLGAFICYDLKDVFSHPETCHAIDSLAIAADPFLTTDAYRRFEAFKVTKQKIHKYVMLGIPYKLSAKDEYAMVSNNPESYVTYLTLGEYFQKKKNYEKAIRYYEESLQHEVSSKNEMLAIKAKIEECKKEKS
ncbi:C45 family autoproteolytic acyltransferase/hydolase [Dyadobacter subterraneus]|uniref:Peptidase C45 n=1 Tax=Dyadobacter subterraneus TaxID=2773304 RepID=A0ABR9WF71_9BACT|nr:C45 family autoproteolytic acyltransferase/hydolase [Dyadobacter subterraneus]MBE9464138.1 peptidase C45 [Dyadobacter subterraneus]